MPADQGNAVYILFALSVLIFAMFLVFGLILTRSLVRLWAERRAGQMGSRFKVKMVLGAMGVSLLPVVFLFFFSYALVNRTLNLWFPRPLEIANEQSQFLLSRFEDSVSSRLNRLAADSVSREAAEGAPVDRNPAFDAFWITDSKGRVTGESDFAKDANAKAKAGETAPPPPKISLELLQTTESGTQIWKMNGRLYLTGSAPRKNGGTLYLARLLPNDFSERSADINTQTQTYAQQKQHLRAYKREILLALMLITLVLLFTTTWLALFLSKQVTVPIQCLAEATREISRGNLDLHRGLAQDEFGTLVRSFNRMTEQLGEGRRQINEFTRSLEQASKSANAAAS